MRCDLSLSANRPASSSASREDEEEEEEEEGHVARQRIDRCDAAAAYRPRCEEEQGHQKKEKSHQNRRPS